MGLQLLKELEDLKLETTAARVAQDLVALTADRDKWERESVRFQIALKEAQARIKELEAKGALTLFSTKVRNP